MATSQDPQEDRYQRFVGLLAQNEPSIRRFVRSVLLSEEGVDDVTQDTALECWKKFSDFEAGSQHDGKDEFIRWAFVIARFKILSWQRDRSRDRLVFRENVITRLADFSIQDGENGGLERKALEDCLGRIEDDSKRLLLSVYREGDSIARIADESGEKARRLYSRVNILRKQLLDCVKKRLAEGNEYA